MADQDDLDHLKSGSLDLVRCVLDGADLSGMDLQSRDFQHARLKATNFSGANLLGAKLLGASHSHANFSRANLSGVKFDGAIFGLNFTGANLTGATFSGILHKCTFVGANICGANFQKVTLQEGCSFDNVVFDENTNFEGTKSERPYLKTKMLFGYSLERGVLKKTGAQEMSLDAASSDAVTSLDEGIRLLSQVPLSGASAGLIGHNMPPPEFQISKSERDNAIAEFTSARETILAGTSESSQLLIAKNHAITIGKAALVWTGTKIDIAASEFAKSFGSTLGSKTGQIMWTLYLSGAMDKIVAALSKLIL